MTPGARLQAAIDVLDAWGAGRPVEQALIHWARGARYAGSGDRAAVRDHVYDVLRARGSCAALGGGTDGRALIIGLLRLQGLDPAACFTGEGHAPAVLTATEASDGASTGPGPEVDVPAWTLTLLTDRAGADLSALLSGFRQRAPLYLRVNQRRAARQDVILRLSADGITAEADPACDTALVVTSGGRRVKSSGAYAEGWVEPQDLSVQRALVAVPWPDTSILDYCAGGGGKALAIADRTAARVLAHDADTRRMADLPARAERAGVIIKQVATGDLTRHAPFGAVLCDVPCSGSGTWRRDPEAKWRLSPERLDGLVQTQAAILADAAPLVAPGGMLVYMTCSLFMPENEAQVAGFLARHPGWTEAQSRIDTGLTASDGFFHAVLRAPGA